MDTSKIMKLLLPIILVALLVFAVVNFKNSQNQKSQGTPIKIGAVYVLSGDLAVYGKEYSNGLQLAAEEINNKGGINGRKVEIITEDDGADATKSVTAVNKLINVDKVDYIFTAFSSPSQATAPIAERSKIIYMSATVSKIGTGNYIFRDYWDMEDQGAAIGKSVTKEGVKKLGIIALTYGDTEVFLKGLKSQTNAEINEERFNFGDTDFKTQLTKIKNFNPDAIVVYAFPGAEATKITQQLIQLGLDNKRLYSGATTYIFPFMTEQFSPTLAKMKAIDTWYTPDSKNSKSNEFLNNYKKKYGQDVFGDAAYPYDDLYALAAAIEKSGNGASTETIAKNLRQMEFDGAGGKLSFDSKGNSMRAATLKIYTTEGWIPYNPE